MKPKYWLFLGASALCAAQLVACSSDFSSCTASRTCASAAGGTSAGDGGSSGSGAGAGGARAEGGARASVAGAPADGGAPSEGGTGGENELAAGAGGEGNAVPALFEACAVKGQTVCDGPATAERLACDGKQWQAAPTCGSGLLCNSSNGKCAAIVPECTKATPGDVVCRGDLPLTCGPDLVTATEGKACVGLCKNGICQAPLCGDQKVEPGEECDDSALTQAGECVKCKNAVCGDGSVRPGVEQCDDGNVKPGDGCSATCQAEPVQVVAGDAHTCVLSSTGVVKCWGINVNGNLGLGDTLARGGELSTVPSRLKPVDLGKNRKAIALAAGGPSTCAVLDNGSLKCWGSNAYGQLGTGDKRDRGVDPADMGDGLKPVNFGAGRSVTSVSLGDTHTCAVSNVGEVKCWGANVFGALGQENTEEYLSPEVLAPINLGGPAKAVSASLADTTCVLLDTGSAKCWGDSYYLSLPEGYPGGSGIGDEAGEIARLQPINVGGGHKLKMIVADLVTYVVRDDGALKVWGVSFDGLLGMPGTEDSGRGEELLGASPTVDLGTGRTVKSVSSSSRHTCAVLDNNWLKCWGSGGDGRLGLGSTDEKGSIAGTMGDQLPPVNLAGHSAVQVAVGGSHTCALLDNGTLKCWGYNARGQLGLGDTRSRGDTGGQLAADTTVDLSF